MTCVCPVRAVLVVDATLGPSGAPGPMRECMHPPALPWSIRQTTHCWCVLLSVCEV